MPIYEYTCTKCKRIVEVLQKANDPPPQCHGVMKKLISKNSFILKGTGWYKTDYQDKKRPKPSADKKPSTGKKV